MISTNKVQPKKDNRDLKLNILTTNKIEPSKFPETFPDMPGAKPMKTRKIDKFVTTGNMEQFAADEKRKQLIQIKRQIKRQRKIEREKKRAARLEAKRIEEEKLKAQKAKEEKAKKEAEKKLTKSETETNLKEIKKPGRPKKTDEEKVKE